MSEEPNRGGDRGRCFDEAVALARVGGDRAMLSEVAKLLLDVGPELMRGIRKAIETADGAGLERAAHSLKGSVANFGAAEVRETARMLEQMAREDRVSGADEVYQELEQQVQRLTQALQAMLQMEIT